MHEPRRALGAPGAVRLREQPLRDGHRTEPIAGRDRPRARAPSYEMPAWSVDGMDVARDAHKRLDTRPRPCGKAADRTSSSAAPTASVPTRCTTRTSIETRPRSSTGRSGIRSSSSETDSARAERSTTLPSARWKTRSPPRSTTPSHSPKQGTDEPVERPHSLRLLGGRTMTVATAHLTYREAMREAIREAHATGRPGVPHGRGRRPVRRQLRRQQRASRRVRPRPDPRHAALGVGVRGRRDRSRDRPACARSSRS